MRPVEPSLRDAPEPLVRRRANHTITISTLVLVLLVIILVLLI